MVNKRNEPMNVGLDIGFGNIKAVFGNESVIFPSVAGARPVLRFAEDELPNQHPSEQIYEGDQPMWVGDLALKHLRAEQQTRLRGRSANNDDTGMEFRVLMMKAALAKLFPGQQEGTTLHLRIATGLPVNHMAQAKSLKARIAGQHLVKTDHTSFVANIVEVAVMPEPRGTMFAFTLNADGKLNKRWTASTTVVFNGGTVTNDVQYDEDGAFIDAKSGSSRTGYHLAQSELIKIIEERFGETPGGAVIESLLKNNHMRVQGQVENLAHEVERALIPTRNGAVQLLADTIETGMTVDCIIVSGGYAMNAGNFKAIADIYPQAIRSENPLFDTAEGYYRWSQFKWRS